MCIWHMASVQGRRHMAYAVCSQKCERQPSTSRAVRVLACRLWAIQMYSLFLVHRSNFSTELRVSSIHQGSGLSNSARLSFSVMSLKGLMEPRLDAYLWMLSLLSQSTFVMLTFVPFSFTVTSSARSVEVWSPRVGKEHRWLPIPCRSAFTSPLLQHVVSSNKGVSMLLSCSRELGHLYHSCSMVSQFCLNSGSENNSSWRTVLSWPLCPASFLLSLTSTARFQGRLFLRIEDFGRRVAVSPEMEGDVEVVASFHGILFVLVDTRVGCKDFKAVTVALSDMGEPRVESIALSVLGEFRFGCIGIFPSQMTDDLFAKRFAVGG